LKDLKPCGKCQIPDELYDNLDRYKSLFLECDKCTNFFGELESYYERFYDIVQEDAQDPDFEPAINSPTESETGEEPTLMMVRSAAIKYKRPENAPAAKKAKKDENIPWQDRILVRKYFGVEGFFASFSGIEQPNSNAIIHYLRKFRNEMSSLGMLLRITDLPNLHDLVKEFVENPGDKLLGCFFVHIEDSFGVVYVLHTFDGPRIMHFDPTGNKQNIKIEKAVKLFGKRQADRVSSGFISVLSILRTLIFRRLLKKNIENEAEVTAWVEHHSKMENKNLESLIDDFWESDCTKTNSEFEEDEE